MLEKIKSLIINLISKEKQLTEEEKTNRNEEFKINYRKVHDLLNIALEKYNEENCQCAHPRFQQLIGIDCSKTKDSLKCWETEIMISSSKKYFDILESNLKDENTNEKWICKKCKSVYEYGWSDFSIYIERQKLNLVDLKTELIGQKIKKPIPLFLGLIGHSYPNKNEIQPTEFEVFEKYITEK